MKPNQQLYKKKRMQKGMGTPSAVVIYNEWVPLISGKGAHQAFI